VTVIQWGLLFCRIRGLIMGACKVQTAATIRANYIDDMSCAKCAAYDEVMVLKSSTTKPSCR